MIGLNKVVVEYRKRSTVENDVVKVKEDIALFIGLTKFDPVKRRNPSNQTDGQTLK